LLNIERILKQKNKIYVFSYTEVKFDQLPWCKKQMSLSNRNLLPSQKPGVQTRKLAILAELFPVYGFSFHVPFHLLDHLTLLTLNRWHSI
jgi:hypothetical protein